MDICKLQISSIICYFSKAVLNSYFPRNRTQTTILKTHSNHIEIYSYQNFKFFLIYIITIEFFKTNFFRFGDDTGLLKVSLVLQ